MTAFEQAHWQVLLVERVVILIGGRIFGNFFATRLVCVEINAEIGKQKLMGMARSGILNDLEVRDFD